MTPHKGFEDPTPVNAFGFQVQHALWYTGAAMSTSHDTAIVLHTTEGFTDEGALNTFHQRNDPPHWTMDDDSMYLIVPLNRTAAALRHGATSPPGFSPNSCAIQFEIATKSQLKLWLLDAGRLNRLAAAVAYSMLYLGYGLDAVAYPNPLWEDDKSDIHTIWASRNTRRQWAEVSWRYPDAGPGKIWDHCSVPYQDTTWHYDCGALAINGQVMPKVRELMKSVLDPDPPNGGSQLAGEADKVFARAMAQGNTESDLAGDQTFETGRRYGYRNVALSEALKNNKDAIAGWHKGQAERTSDGFTGS